MVLAGVPATAGAQSMPTGRAARAGDSPIRGGTVEVSAFAGWTLAGALAGQSALLTRDTTGAPSPALPLFSVAVRQNAAPSFGGRIGYNFTSRLGVEGTFTYSRPNLIATISGDNAAPNVPPFTLARVNEFAGDLSLTTHLPRLAFAGGRGIPFLAVGAGYLRQVFSGSGEAIDGQIYSFGGGVKLFTRSRGRTGVRVDAREYLRHPGPDNAGTTRANFGVTGSLMFVF